jgi:hypothetical protein
MDMSSQNFSMSFTVDQTPEAVIAAICNVRGWWSEGIVGRTEQVGDRFTHSVLDLHRCDLAVKELVPGKKVVWTVIDNYFSFTQDDSEWQDTDIVFEIARRAGKTEVSFTHVGLVPAYECYNVCIDGWTTYLNSLRDLITTGTGQPNPNEARTTSEHALVRAKQAS